MARADGDERVEELALKMPSGAPSGTTSSRRCSSTDESGSTGCRSTSVYTPPSRYSFAARQKSALIGPSRIDSKKRA